MALFSVVGGALRVLVSLIVLWVIVGWAVRTPDPFAIDVATLLVAAGLCAVGPVRRGWFGWIRTGRLSRRAA
jgi:hypothetical protein